MNKRIYACYSPSHTPLLEKHFLPSIPSGFDVVLRRHPQVCETGAYAAPNWSAATRNKIPLILEAIKHETETFVFSDVDIRFYNFRPEDIEREMKGNIWNQKPDIMCQADASSFCTGFMFIKPCQAVYNLFNLVLKNCHLYTDDQHTFNHLAVPSFRGRVGVSVLPVERYWTIGPNCPNWDERVPPDNMAIHHGNWVVGLENKMRLLDSVFQKVGKK